MFSFMNTKEKQIKIALSLGAVIFLIVFGYIERNQLQSIKELKNTVKANQEKISFLETTFASSSLSLQQEINQAELDLSSKLARGEEAINTLEALLDSYKKEVGNISGTVTDLQKLSQTDPELLQKYSKVFFLNEHYSPARLEEIIEKYKYFEEKPLKINAQVWPFLENLLKKAENDGVELFVYSAFRSFNEQNALKEIYSVTYGAGTANQFSADQGYSEHQLGTTVDFITIGISGTLEGFDETEAYQWLLNNAYKFGFVMSYPEDNSYYVYEPWHWRFVGVKLATDLYNQGKHFYDLEQREIDEYLINLFE